MKILKSNYGSAMPYIVITLFFILAIVAAMLQTFSLTAVARSVRAAMQQTAQAAISENSEETYGSKRESFAGAYNVAGDATPQKIDAKAQLQRILSLSAIGNDLVKYDNKGKELYRIKDILLQLQNPPHKQSNQSLIAVISVKLIQPAKYGDSAGDVEITLLVKAENPNKFG